MESKKILNFLHKNVQKQLSYANICFLKSLKTRSRFATDISSMKHRASKYTTNIWKKA